LYIFSLSMQVLYYPSHPAFGHITSLRSRTSRLPFPKHRPGERKRERRLG
jgi:hypothetical protein